MTTLITASAWGILGIAAVTGFALVWLFVRGAEDDEGGGEG